MNPSASDSQIKDYIRRPNRYENIDGTNEILFGALYLAGWLAGEIGPRLPATHFWQHNLIGVLIPIYAAFALCYGVAVPVNRAIKRRITFPRTGYVARAKCGNKPRAVFFFFGVAVAGALVSFLVFQAQRHHAVVPVRIAMIGALAATYAGAALMWSREHVWKMFVALGLALGLAAFAEARAAAKLTDIFHPAMLIVALTWFASGIATLLLYIRRTHPPVPEGE